MSSARRFPPPWTVEDIGATPVVMDSTPRAVAENELSCEYRLKC